MVIHTIPYNQPQSIAEEETDLLALYELDNELNPVELFGKDFPFPQPCYNNNHQLLGPRTTLGFLLSQNHKNTNGTKPSITLLIVKQHSPICK